MEEALKIMAKEYKKYHKYFMVLLIVLVILSAYISTMLLC